MQQVYAAANSDLRDTSPFSVCTPAQLLLFWHQPVSNHISVFYFFKTISHGKNPDTNLGMLFAIPTNGCTLHSEEKVRKNL